MALTHEFLLIKKEIMVDQGFYFSPMYEEMVTVHDDLILYISDSLVWLPTYNPSKKEFQSGLSYHGVTIIQDQGATLLKNICHSWYELFLLAPQTFALTGSYTWKNDEGIESVEYERIHCERNQLTTLLKNLATLADRASANDYCILHKGL
ncbi:hypothetical protein [Brevibacillus sp. SYSU BS000544]|uniref:hypothetical protein n=1 Tax=Brevibacillus sp. SYSU BS000544 TaxID=3416443 RepID=UPI003CE55D80